MDKMIKRAVPALVLVFALLCCAGCAGNKNAATAAPSGGTVTTPSGETPSGEPTLPNTVEGVEDWTDTGTQLPNTQPGNQQPGNQTGNQQPGNQTGNQQTSNQTGNQQPGNQTGNQQSGNQNGNQTGNETPGTQTGNQPGNQPTGNQTLTYAQYLALSTSEQQAYFESFASVDAFYEWLETAEKEYEESIKNDSVTGDGTLDLGDYIGKQN